MIFPEFVPQEVIDKTYGPSKEQIALQNSRKATTPNTNFNNAWDLGVFGKLKGLLGKGSTCTNTATGCYYPNRSTAGSRNLLDNPQKAGFQIINQKQAVPGSIIVISNPDNTKRHSVIFDRVHQGESYQYSDPNDKNTYLIESGDTLVNYSNGGHKSKNYRQGVPLNKAFPKRTKHIYLKAFQNGGNITTEQTLQRWDNLQQKVLRNKFKNK